MFDGNDNQKPTVEDRYAGAVNSSNLRADPRSRMGDADVLGAIGIADRELTEGRTSRGEPVRPAPLAVALERLLHGGDNRASHTVARILADMLWRKARESKDHKLPQAKAQEMAKMVLAWYRHGTCKACGGHGYSLITGTKSLSERDCPSCDRVARGKRPFDKAFKGYPVDLARWLAGELDRNLGRAGERAMAHLAARFDLE